MTEMPASPTEYSRQLITFFQIEDRFRALQRRSGPQLEIQIIVIGTAHAKTFAARFKCRAAARLDGNLEPHTPAKHMHMAHEFSPRGRHVLPEIRAGPKQHSVRQPDRTGERPHLSHQDCGVFFVVVSGFCEILRRNLERSASSGIQDAAKQRRGIEPRQAQP